MQRSAIEEQSRALVADIRAYAREQVALWRRLPYLALEADGRNGFSDNYSRAYRQGVWAVESSVKSGSYTVYVDLATGELIDPFAFHANGTISPVGDAAVLALAVSLSELDARDIVEQLKQRSKEPVASYYEPAVQKRWREDTRRECKLTPIYDASGSRSIALMRYADDRVL